ncbi:helix-turn-helix domain-containing protein [Heyndrickxia acidiproducens]|uniref:helix-turn-helix domain-containing protein n=1 Tax=Heyndrickxia acidiproducens TaxID=1121084 RepID=UPI00036961E9|nr:helix-turn-helix transcriptional regulator [Heyndrickxia acidiproducens]
MIGNRIKELRLKKGLSINQLAERAGVSKSYISYIEREIRFNPSLEFLTKIAKPLDTTVEYLLQDVLTPRNNLFDEEWESLLEEAIKEGMNKEDFIRMKNFIFLQEKHD